jgi:hypothetical protein
MLMAFPTWNPDWEKPDPLRGKSGWTFRDYVNLGVAVGLAVIAIVLVMPPVLKARDLDGRSRWLNRLREQEFEHRQWLQNLGR